MEVREALGRFLTKMRALHFLYAVVGLIFGVMFLAITPPGKNPDEFNHYLRIQQMLNGHVVLEVRSDLERTEMLNGYGEVDSGTLEFMGSGENVMHTNEMVDVTNNQQSVSSPLSYLPGLVGGGIGRVLGFSALVEFYLMRMIGLLVGLVLVGLAIRLLPFGKWTLFAIGLFPSTITQFASVTADTMTIGVTFLFIAVLVKMICEKGQMRMRDLVILAICTVGLGLLKISYLPLAALALLPIVVDPKKRTKKLWGGVLIASIVVAVILGATWYLAVKGVWVNLEDPAANMAVLLRDPVGILKDEVISALIMSPHGFYQMMNLIGVFGADTTPLNPIMMIVCVVVTTITCLLNRRRLTDFIPKRAATILKATFVVWTVGIVALIYVSLYVAQSFWTNGFTGVQGRYFIPLLPLVILPFLPRIKLEDAGRRKLVRFVTIAMSAILLITAVTLYYHYHVQDYVFVV